MSEPRFHVFLLGVFALPAMAMAGAGTYSATSCLVSQRTGEIAVRIALAPGAWTLHSPLDGGRDIGHTDASIVDGWKNNG